MKRWPQLRKQLVGCMPDWKIHPIIRDTLNKVDQEITTREVIQMFTEQTTSEEIAMPEHCNEKVGPVPKDYADGSMRNPGGLHWAKRGV